MPSITKARDSTLVLLLSSADLLAILLGLAGALLLVLTVLAVVCFVTK